jgi:hypothetical protein
MEKNTFRTPGNSAEADDFRTEVPFHVPCFVCSKTLLANETLTVRPNEGTQPHVPGFGAIYRLTGDGSHVPGFDPAFKRSSSSGDYVSTSGELNLITFLFDGVDYWYNIVQAQ